MGVSMARISTMRQALPESLRLVAAGVGGCFSVRPMEGWTICKREGGRSSEELGVVREPGASQRQEAPQGLSQM